jgi:hypothetical protein
MKHSHLFIAVAVWLLTACANKQQESGGNAIMSPQHIVGHNTRYGLACDGSTDSILIILPAEGNQLDTFDIIAAHEQRRIYGRPHIGDELAIILADDSTQQVSMMVNLSALQDTWYYMVSPTLRHPLPPTLPDSIRERIMAQREYSLRLKRDGTARAMGGGMRQRTPTSTMSPVSYPLPKRYAAWQLTDGQLILYPDSTRKQSPDTVTIKSLRRDTLVLQFPDHEQSYYRKRSS